MPSVRQAGATTFIKSSVGSAVSQWILPAIAAIALIFTSSIKAQSGADDGGESPSFLVKDFLLTGESPLSRRQIDGVLEPYRGQTLTIDGLRQAATDLEKLLALEGYNFYRATLPPQTLSNDTVKLAIERVDIANVSVSGNQFFSKDNIQRSLPLVAKGRSPNTQKIASALLLAEDNPAKDVRVVFIKGDSPQTIDANIAVTDQNPNELFAWANNAGSRLTTDSRLGIQYHNRNLWGRDHQIALSYTVSPEDFSELNQYGVNYRVPIYALRGMVNAFYSKSDADTGRVADVFDVSGAGESFGVGYTHYFDKRTNYQHRLKVGITDKLFDSDVLFERTQIGDDVRSRPLTVEYISRYDKDNWLLNSVWSWSSNLSGGSFNNAQSYEAVRAGADNEWSKAEVSGRLDYRWARDWRSQLFVFGQVTSDALITGEGFGMGGALGDFGPRGFYEREVVVDEGFKASAVLIRNFSTKKMQLGVFYDVATGDRSNPQVGESDSETLSSVGLSYKWNPRPDLSLDLDYGYVLDGIDQTFSDGTDDGDSRLHMSVKYFPRFGGAK